MGASYIRLWELHGSDVVNDFFARSREAEAHREREYNAAVKLASRWRGFWARNCLAKNRAAAVKIQRAYRDYERRQATAKRAQREIEEAKRALHNTMATQIQRTWRGYISRKKIFDFRARKQYIDEITKRMADLRVSLAEHAALQRAQDEARRERLVRESLDRLAGTRHHWLGTRAVPGVMHRVVSAQVVNNTSDPTTARNSKLRRPPLLQPPLQKMVELEEELDPYEGGTHDKLPRIGKLPEAALRESQGLKNWVAQTVGRNPRGIRVKPKLDINDVSKLVEKEAQGPFLPKPLLEKKKAKPLRPTLRVQTDFYDTKNFVRDEKQREAARRVSDKVFATVKHVKHHHPDYFLAEEPYRVARKIFREEDRTKFVAPRV
ncbi:hypothetical protein DFJ73DRAFT_850624 [Zopfochytrium polystomum]|nr:hypothetical protein DFJ73DRAFT_850624 [Zopfochytrium polystomum]